MKIYEDRIAQSWKSELWNKAASHSSGKALAIYVSGIFVIGFVLRIVLLSTVTDTRAFPTSEIVNIAISLASTGNYTDAYGPGAGPTAHCAPMLPLMFSALLRIFGIGTPAAALAMKTASAVASALAFALLPILADVCEIPLAYGLLAGIAGALLPLDFWFQISGCEDAPFTAAALVGLCILMCRIRARAQFSKGSGAVLGVAAGLGCLLNPIMLPVFAAWVIVTVIEHRRQLSRALIFGTVSAISLIATLAPWAIRNYEVLGAPIWARSNFWLELQISNNDVLTADELRNFAMPAFVRMHPTGNSTERAKVKRLGEVAYMRTKRKQALVWISTHKRRFVELTVERFRLFWIPGMRRIAQTIGEAALTALSLIGLVLMFRSKVSSVWIFAFVVILYPPVYYLIQVTPRYRFPLEPFLFLLSAYCVLGSASAIDRQLQLAEIANTVSARR